MGRIHRYIATTVFVTFIAAQGQATLSAPDDRIAFLSEESFPHSVPLPPSALKVLLRDESVRESMERASDAEKRDPARLFRAAEVHLFGPNETDLFIVGNLPIAGANNGWFWVVRSARKNPRVVLFTTGYDLELLHSRTNRYRDIRCTWWNPNITQTQIYKFDGARYRLWKERWRENH
jgi:hypothetical protein